MRPSEGWNQPQIGLHPDDSEDTDQVLSFSSRIHDGAIDSFPTTTAENTTMRKRLSYLDCVKMRDWTTVTNSEMERETIGPGGTLL
jgi:hypothetical protein